jgi:hypothetical protein
MSDGLQNEIERVREVRATAQRDLALYDKRYPPQETFEGEGGSRKRVPAPDPERDNLVAAVAETTAELAKLQEDQRAVVIPNVDGLDGWLRSHAGAKFVPAVYPVAKVGRNESTVAALERIADEQRRLNDEMAVVVNSPRTISEAKAAMRAQVGALTARGRPDTSGLFGGEAIKWPVLQVPSTSFGAHEYSTFAEIADTLGLFAWAHRDALIAALDEQIEGEGAGDTGALTAEDQASRIRELEAALLVLQRQGEALIERLEGDGIPVRRSCTDPLVLLGIEFSK